MRSISIQKHDIEIRYSEMNLCQQKSNGNLATWDHYVSEAMKWKVGNTEPISFNNIEEFGLFDTLNF